MLPSCPSFPDPTVVDLSKVGKDSRVVQALDQIDTMLQAASSKIPSGLVATIVLGQDTLWSKGYGSRNVSDIKAPPPDTGNLVRIASISKIFTSLLLFILQRDGLVNFDDPVTKWLPGEHRI